MDYRGHKESDTTERLSLTGRAFPAQTVKNLPAMQEICVGSLGREDPLEESMSIHSSILGWRIPLTEEAGRLWSIGSLRIRHN